MGRAARELDVQTSQYVALPRKNYNFCQIFKSQVEEGFYQRLSDKEVGWTFSDQEEVAIMDMRMGIEKSFLFGARARISLPDSQDEILFTGGIWNQTDRTFTYENMTEQGLTALSRAAFTGRSGSSRKVLIGGSGLIEAICMTPHVKSISADDRGSRMGHRLPPHCLQVRDTLCSSLRGLRPLRQRELWHGNRS